MIALMIFLAFAAGVCVVAYDRTGLVAFLAGSVALGVVCLVVAALWATWEAGR